VGRIIGQGDEATIGQRPFTPRAKKVLEQCATFVYMSDTVGIRELRQNLSAYLRQVEAGQRLIVTERNRPVAELVPVGRHQPGLSRLVAEGRVVPPARAEPLDFSPIPLRGDRPATRALEVVRGERG
jgi:prevent-host-death family protein